MKNLLFLLLAIIISINLSAEQQSDSTKKHLPSIIQNSEIHGQWFLAYQRGFNDSLYNYFTMRRAYFTVKTKLTKNLTARITQDLTIDNEGSDKGNVELRFKYLFLQWKLPDFSNILTNSYFEFGQVHRPWLDYEEHINIYRVQGKMATESYHLFNSAGFGITYNTLFGGKLSHDKLENLNHHYPGKYGSFALGVYNGGGYHALENNFSKNIETRLSLRPFPEKLPGLQVSYFGIFGKGNIKSEPDFMFNLGFLSYESKYFVVTGQYFTGEGNSNGSWIDINNKSTPYTGYSAFAEAKLPKYKLAIFGRYDYFDLQGHHEETRYIAGLAYKFTKKSKVILDYNFDDKDKYFAEIALEVHF